MLVAAQVDFAADDRWRRVKRLVQRVDRQHLQLWTAPEHHRPALLAQQIDAIGRTDRRRAEVPRAWQTVFKIVLLSVDRAQAGKETPIFE